MNSKATGWETQPRMVQKLVETGVRCQAVLVGKPMIGTVEICANAAEQR